MSHEQASQKEEDYKYLGVIPGSSLPYKNTSTRYVIVNGASFNVPPTTQAAGAILTLLQVKDAQGNIVDAHQIGAIASAAAPTSTTTQYVSTLPRRMLIPPNGQAVDPSGVVNNLQLIECRTLKLAMLAR